MRFWAATLALRLIFERLDLSAGEDPIAPGNLASEAAGLSELIDALAVDAEDLGCLSGHARDILLAGDVSGYRSSSPLLSKSLSSSTGLPQFAIGHYDPRTFAQTKAANCAA